MNRPLHDLSVLPSRHLSAPRHRCAAPRHRSRVPGRRAARRSLALRARAVLAATGLACVALVAAPMGGATTATAATGCSFSSKLVPSCGRLWGIAPRQFMQVRTDIGVATDEANAQRTFDIVHVYHVNGSHFPTTLERGIAMQPGKNRLLLINWKPATDMSWRAEANGGADARIDSEAAYLKSTYHHPFFLTVWHEPENDVNDTPGSGRTSADYAAMYRHTVQRLRADGVDFAITMMDYEGYDAAARRANFPGFWPGNDVVDWIGIDPYGSGAATGYLSGDFTSLVNRPELGFPGYYDWALRTHPGIPMMLCEWGIGESASNPSGKANFFRSVVAQLPRYPNIKAMSYFDTSHPHRVEVGDTRPESTATSLAAFVAMSHSSAVVTPRFHYSGTGIALGS